MAQKGNYPIQKKPNETKSQFLKKIDRVDNL